MKMGVLATKPEMKTASATVSDLMPMLWWSIWRMPVAQPWPTNTSVPVGNFPGHTPTEGDPLAQKGKRQCNHCKIWFSSKTNSSSWKAHLSSKHVLSQARTDKVLFALGSSVLVQTTLKPMSFPNHVACKYKNVVVDFVIGGDISLRAAGGTRFKELL
jgi:hypothetical protein